MPTKENAWRPEWNYPYHMYDAILAQSRAFAHSVVASCPRLFLVGIGTSHHAALVGEHLFCTYGGGVDVRAVHSFDLALYGPELGADDCGVAC